MYRALATCHLMMFIVMAVLIGWHAGSGNWFGVNATSCAAALSLCHGATLIKKAMDFDLIAALTRATE